MNNLFQISPSSGVPIYRQIIEQVRRMIAGGHLHVGEELPSVRNLALQLEVNPMTISKAYSLLEAEGLVFRKRGRGMYVADSRRDSRPLDERLDLLTPKLRETIVQAHQLEIPAEKAMELFQSLWREP